MYFSKFYCILSHCSKTKSDIVGGGTEHVEETSLTREKISLADLEKLKVQVPEDIETGKVTVTVRIIKLDIGNTERLSRLLLLNANGVTI